MANDFRITIVHQAALGDTVLLLPLLRSLRLRWPSAQMTIVTRPEFGGLLVNMGAADRWSSADDQSHTAWFAEYQEHSHTTSPEWAQCDVLISAVSSGHDAWAAHARAAMTGTGGAVYFFLPRPPASYPGHVTEYHRQQLSSLNLPPSPMPSCVSHPDGAVLIHPGSGGAAKCWPIEKFIESSKILRKFWPKIAYILGEAEIEKWPAEKLSAIRNEFECVMRPSLQELAGHIRNSALWVGNDSGPTHLAAALGASTVAIFGPSDDRQWRPIGPNVTVVRGEKSSDVDAPGPFPSVEQVMRAVRVKLPIRPE